jgi:hypothetical protein
VTVRASARNDKAAKKCLCVVAEKSLKAGSLRGWNVQPTSIPVPGLQMPKQVKTLEVPGADSRSKCHCSYLGSQERADEQPTSRQTREAADHRKHRNEESRRQGKQKERTAAMPGREHGLRTLGALFDFSRLPKRPQL